MTEAHRIMIVGCPGAGKSTLARAIHEITGHELIILDQYYYRENWTESDPEDWVRTVTTLADRPSWIMDGNYGGTMEIRLNRADAVIFLDRPTHILLWRVLRRTYKSWGKTRPGMPAGCPERFDKTFILYVLNYNRTRRARLLERLQKLEEGKQVHVLHNDGEIRAFIKQFAANHSLI